MAIEPSPSSTDSPSPSSTNTPSPASPASDKKTTLNQYLEIVTKLAIGASTACYVLGFLVVQLHLARLGYMGLGLAQFQYLAAGLWALAPLPVGWLAFFLFFPEMLASPRGKLSGRLFLVVLAGFFVSLFALAGLAGSVPTLPIPVRAVMLIVLSFLIPVMLYLSIDQLRWLANQRFELPDQFRRMYLDAIKGALVTPVLTVVYIALYIAMFSRSLYPEIPARLGGGMPRIVRFVIDKSDLDSLSAAGVEIPNGSLTSSSQKLLIATDNDYVFVGAAGTPVSIRSDLVRAVLSEP